MWCQLWDNALLYFLLPFSPKQLQRPKTEHLAGEAVDPHHSTPVCFCLVSLCVNARAWMCGEQTSHKSLPPSTQCAHQLGMIMDVSEALIVGCWSVKSLERNREGRGSAREKGRKNGGKAQLTAASNWAERVSMADQTHIQCSSEERERERERATGNIAGQSGLQGWRGVRRAGGWEAGHTPAATASLWHRAERASCRAQTHTPSCILITQARRTQKQKHDEKATYETKQLV